MSPFIAGILGKLFNYLIEHSDEIIEKIKAQFPGVIESEKVKTALEQFKESPSMDTFNCVHDCLLLEGQDTKPLEDIVINSANV